ncbi:hypothetical protein GCM10027088_53160 [Nocardia goodfellowii]|uniref:Uncharacterized protein n=1 Tax=Nocardia goodfellowii TaxID=882446 RepID=A0ABS4QJC0_9NOCA|nr:hypothetical protein [Nocardia goodfellowii]
MEYLLAKEETRPPIVGNSCHHARYGDFRSVGPVLLAQRRRRQDCRLGEIFTVSFFRGLDPSEVVRRFSRGEDHGRESAFDELMEQAGDSSSRTSEGRAVGVWQAGEWSVAIEPFGWMATLPDVLAELSRDCEVVAITHHAYAEDMFAYAIDGRLVTG